MRAPVSTTPYDLRFGLFGIPITVTPMFWVTAIIGGLNTDISEHPDLVLIWVGCLFVSILVHELGHAALAKLFGWPPEIFLYAFGGLAVYRPSYGHTTTRSVLISLAGPGAGFVLYGLIYLLDYEAFSSGWIFTLEKANALRLYDFFEQMKWINLGWGIANLLPVLPLDGGRIAEAILVRVRPWNGARQAVILSVVASAAAALYFLSKKEKYGTFPALLFGILCIFNVQSLQDRSRW
jgi:membrane-associated protease RseP (regulator of RpoE activity)